MRYTAASLSRFTAKHGISSGDIIKIFVLATGYDASFPHLLRAYVQGRSVAGRLAGRTRIVPIRTVVSERRAAA